MAPAIDTQNAEFHAIIEELLQNPEVSFSSQQRGDNDLSQDEKRSLAVRLCTANKNVFLVKFGKHLNIEQLNCFRQFCNDSDKGVEIKSTLDHLQLQLDQQKVSKQVKNRRYEALQGLISGGTYFSELEMMKRNPLLYNELVGQYLTEEERRAINRASQQETLVEILMEGIERDDARELRKRQADIEDSAMEEADTSDEDARDSADNKEAIHETYSRSDNESPEPEVSHSRWGECKELADNRINHDEFYARSKTVEIASKQKALLREEFVSLMHESFLDGKDDFDYAAIDHDESYDNLHIITQDEEDKYFDSEEANEMQIEEVKTNSNVSSEDELEIFMSRLHKSNLAVSQLSNDFNKL